MRYLGLDLGNKTLGIAISDETATFVSPLENFFFENRDFLTAAKRVIELCNEHSISEVALGNPLLMSGEESTRSRISHKFIAMLGGLNPSVKVVLIDERLTSVQAKEILQTCSYNEAKRTRVRDSVAACLILESFLSGKFRNSTK